MAKITLTKTGRAPLGTRMHDVFEVRRGDQSYGMAYRNGSGTYLYGTFTGSKARLIQHVEKLIAQGEAA
jgi:hypothetical protein